MAYINEAKEVNVPHIMSRRSPVLSLHGAVACSQPLAAEIGLSILKSGGNCVDACVAVAAALNVTEPCSTGIGGDAFALYFDAATGKVEGINASGRSPSALTLDKVMPELKNAGSSGDSLPPSSIHAVTVPGAVAGWVDSIEKWGSLPLSTVLQPAIDLAENGFPVGPKTAVGWAKQAELLRSQMRRAGQKTCPMLNADLQPPKAGDVFRNPELASTLRDIARDGKKGFYAGRAGKAIVSLMNSLGGYMTAKDLEEHTSTFPEPIHVQYGGVDVWEIPPNGQGITALLALNILRGLDMTKLEHNSTEYTHILIESLRLAFADTRYYVADSDKVKVPVKELLSEEYAAVRRKLVQTDRASVDVKRGSPVNSSNTVSFCAVDGKGNACSFINSNYEGFGSCLVPSGCGFTLQNRGSNFSLTPGHPNVLAPAKRPYHTIIPGMATQDGKLYCPFSVMGGFMQPQGHVQVMLNMLVFAMDPQTALDAPRFCIAGGEANGVVYIEDGFPEQTIEGLRKLGHSIQVVSGHDRAVFGKGQIIKAVKGVLWSGTDCRADGMAVGY